MGFDRSSRADALDVTDLHTTRSVISTSMEIKRDHEDHEVAFQAWKRDVNGRIQTLISHQEEIQHKWRKATAALLWALASSAVMRTRNESDAFDPE